MKKIIITIFWVGFLILAGILIYSDLGSKQIVGSGKVITKSVIVSDFNKISLSGMGNLIIKQGDEESLQIEAEDNIMDKIIAETKNNSLNISYKREFEINPSKDINFYIKLKEINNIKISGSGTANMESIKTENMEIIVDGSGKIDLAIESNTLKSNISGSGNFNISGKTDYQKVNISGSGKYLAKNLQSKKTIVEIDGSGKAEINTEEKLDINIIGSGSVFYTGNPKITQEISDSGKIEQIGQIESSEVKTFDPILSKEEAYDIARQSDECTNVGVLSDLYVYNEFTRTWWINLKRAPESVKDGCDPTCVVSEDTKTAKVNWSCEGVL